MNPGNPISKHMVQTFIPINSLSHDHLDRLLDDQEVLDLNDGEILFEIGDTDHRTIYLLSGEIELEDRQGNKQIISAGGMESWHPLSHHQPRDHKAIAMSAASVVCFDNSRLDSILSWDQSAGYVIHDIKSNPAYESDKEWMIRLLNSRLFYRVPPGNILEIFHRLKPRRFRANDVVIHQGDDADCCYIIQDGICEVTILAAGATEATPVAILESGQWFGEDALLTGKPRNATITMLADGVLMRLDRRDFDALLREPVVNSVSLDEAREWLDRGARWLDVRTSDEYEQGHLRPATNMPLNVLRLKSRLLNRGKVYITYCDTGRRSASAAFLLNSAGFEVYVLDGGLNGNSSLREQLVE